MSEYEREMWEELYAIRAQVDTMTSYMQQIVSELMKINKSLSSSATEAKKTEQARGGGSMLSNMSDRFSSK